MKTSCIVFRNGRPQIGHAGKNGDAGDTDVGYNADWMGSGLSAFNAALSGEL